MPEQRPSNCSKCTKPATIHLTQIVDGEIAKQDICGQCPHAARIGQADSINLVSGPKPKPKPIVHGIRAIEKGLCCPKCGFSQQSFEQFGRLGCPACYDVFADLLKPVFRKAHPGVEHKGKRPQKTPVSPQQIEALKRELQQCVNSEDYEGAAEIRDRISALEERLV